MLSNLCCSKWPPRINSSQIRYPSKEPSSILNFTTSPKLDFPSVKNNFLASSSIKLFVALLGKSVSGTPPLFNVLAAL